VPINPAASVRGPRHLMRSGKTADWKGSSNSSVQEKAIP
jgi:hypothetical protein